MKTWLAAGMLLVAAACGEGSDTQPAAGDHHMHGGGGSAAIDFGESADTGDADRTVEVTATDQLKFDPAALEVDAGETITFSVTNEGSIDHEFVLGDEGYQRSNSSRMGHGSMGHDGNGVFLEPGDTAEISWRFTEPGEVLYACHVDGHYSAGMFGRIQVR